VDSSISNKITTDLFKAYFDARKNKRSTINALAFEKHCESNIFELADEIMENRYVIQPSICFIVKKPVLREVFAADFRDRVVHHFIYSSNRTESTLQTGQKEISTNQLQSITKL
jgi:hypothetical protein